jgi:two-component system phosphate regulon sensor histidine kinase PhoR
MKNRLSWRPAYWLLISTVLLPTIGTVGVGVLILVFYREAWDVAFGVLVLCFAFFAVAGSSIAVFLLRRTGRLTRLQTDFIARMSHDFRTPLTSIKLFVETLRAGKIDAEEQARCLELLTEETSRMERLIEHVLDWRYIEGRRSVERREPADAEKVARAALAPFVSSLDPASAARVQLVAESPLPPIAVERESAVEAVRNLVQNALRYTSGAVVLGLRASGDLVSFHVRDEGPPIPRNERKQIFRRFYRADRKQEGSGLGLAIAKHVALAHGGQVDLEVDNTGNTFSLYFPIATQAAQQLAPSEQEQA